MNDSRYDLVVVGAGIAGLVAANRAAELGRTVVVLERSEEDRYLCNSRFTGGFFHVAMNAVDQPGTVLREVIDGATAGASDPQLRDALADGIGPAVAWLKRRGVRFVRGGALDWMSHVLSPPGLRRTGLHWEGRAGDVLLRDMADWLHKTGGKILRGHRAHKLAFDGGRVTGVTAERPDGSMVNFVGSVLLADGGFQGNRELVRQYISPQPDALLQRGAGTGRGDGLLLAQTVGARLSGLDRFYGHVQSRQAMTSTDLWPYPTIDLISSAGIVVGADGRRFTDEGLGGVHLANEIARLADPLSTIAIFDEVIWRGPGRDYILPPNPHVLDAGARLYSAPRISELAGALGIAVDALQQTVDEYNMALERRTLGKVRPHRSETTTRAFPLATPPYYALPLCAGITYTMGGIHTNASGRARSENGGVIAGLYAAGSTTGGLEGGPRVGYTGGLSKAVTFGFAVGQAIHADWVGTKPEATAL